MDINVYEMVSFWISSFINGISMFINGTLTDMYVYSWVLNGYGGFQKWGYPKMDGL